MPSHKEILQKRNSEAEREAALAGGEVERIQSLLVTERQAIDQLGLQYDGACRDLARGGSADPVRILAERDRRSHKLRGLEALAAEANAAALRANEAHIAASRQLQTELDREERERLEDVIIQANRKREEAQAALNDAQKAVNDAVWARTRFLRKLDLQARATA